MAFLHPKEHDECAQCPFYEKGVPVSDRLPIDMDSFSGLTLVTDGPGAIEVKEGLIFSGNVGQFTTNAMSAVGVPIQTVHVTGCVRCGLPQGAKLTDSKMDEAVKACRPGVLHNMREMGTKAACLVGATPLKAMAGLKGIDNYRGTVLPPEEGEPWYVTSTLHPGHLLISESRRILYELLAEDLKKAYDLAKGRIGIWESEVRSAKNGKKLLRWLREVEEKRLPMGCDVETDGIDPLECNLLTVGVAAKTKGLEEVPISYPIPWGPAYADYYTPKIWKAIRKQLKRMLNSPEQPVVFHNMSYDVPVLRRHFDIELEADCHDTLLLHHAAYPKFPKKLQQVASHKLPVEPWKTTFRVAEKALNKEIDQTEAALDKMLRTPAEKLALEQATEGDVTKEIVLNTLDKQAFQELLWYNASDTGTTLELFYILIRECKERNVLQVYQDDRELLYETINWSRDGIAVDLHLRNRLIIKYTKETNELREELRELCMLRPHEEWLEDKKELQEALEANKKDLQLMRKECVVCGRMLGSSTALKSHYRSKHPDCAEEEIQILEEEIAVTTAELKDIRNELKELKKEATDKTFNPASPIQLRQVLALRGLRPKKVTKKSMQISTSKDSLWELRDDRLVDVLFRWRKAAKLLSTYLINLDNKLGSDGRLHPTWKLHATPSGRFGTQPAVQNWPSDMKRMMVPGKGCFIVGADYAALELRISAWLAGQEDLIEDFMLNKDIHLKHAFWFFPKACIELQTIIDDPSSTLKAVEKAKEKLEALRKAGKPVTFGKIYRAGDQTLYENIREDRPDVKTRKEHRQLLRVVSEMSRVLDGRYSNLSESARLWQKMAHEQQCLRTGMSGRLRIWPVGEPSLNECANHPIQGFAADIMNAATLRLARRLKKEGLYRNGIKIILQIHDALYLEVDKGLEEYAKEMLEECMTTQLTTRSHVTGKEHTMRFPADASVAMNVAKAA
jgi:uracil-DNA glycosylase family 4